VDLLYGGRKERLLEHLSHETRRRL
jgi:hypothetical protein